MSETGTLSELNVQPGDVVELVGDQDHEHFICIACPPRRLVPHGDHWDFGTALFRDERFIIISRANPAPDLATEVKRLRSLNNDLLEALETLDREYSPMSSRKAAAAIAKARGQS